MSDMDFDDHDHDHGDGLVLPTGYSGIEPADPGEVSTAGAGDPDEPEEVYDDDEAVEDTMGDEAAAPSRLTDEERQQLAEQGLPEEALTVFAVVKTHDGRWIGTSRTDLVSLITYENEANFEDFVAGGERVSGDARHISLLNAIAGLLNQSVQATAGLVVQTMEEKAAKMQEQMKANAILRDVQGKGGLRPRG